MTHRAQQVQRLEAVLGRDRVKSLVAKQRDEHFTRVGIVLNDEDVARYIHDVDLIKAHAELISTRRVLRPVIFARREPYGSRRLSVRRLIGFLVATSAC